jgi:AraC-like DNA-binding protein
MKFLRSLRSASGQEETANSLSKYIAKTVAYIEHNLGHGIGLVEIAEHVELSESHLRTLFRKEMGISLGHYIAKKRLDMAKYRLLHSNMKLNEIAAECGFTNLFVFSAFFKKQLGISPLRYRKNAQLSEM